MTVGYISAVYMYTTEKFPAANSLPSSAIVVLRNVGQNYRERREVRGERWENT